MSRRKTRIVCVADTHNQTPKLPSGDVLIHAGDLTNQGSYTELKKTVEWIEKSDFEAKIVIAGNHDTTLDPAFFYSNQNKWKWPEAQDPEACRRLLTSSPSITYLENQSKTIYLKSPQGPGTYFKIFGSPYSPGKRGWAFQDLDGNSSAETLLAGMENDVDIVVTHTPAAGFCDTPFDGGHAGCPVLWKYLTEVKPLLHVCGHIHPGRGASKILWRANTSSSPHNATSDSPLSVHHWDDPGSGNKKISIIDLCEKSRRYPRDLGLWKKSSIKMPDVHSPNTQDQAITGLANRASSHSPHTDESFRFIEDQVIRETVMINAAIMNRGVDGRQLLLNKPIVVDIELPVLPHSEW